VTAAVSRALLKVAGRCLGTDRQGWALAMEAELEVAIEDGKPFAFAIGCLIAAWREMIQQSEGRLALANYALAFGLVLPTATLQFGQAMGFRMPYEPLSYGLLVATGRNPFLLSSLNSALPGLMILWLVLGGTHVRLAWVLVEGDWPRVIRSGARIAAATTTLTVVAATFTNDLSPLFPQITELGVELAAIMVSARWHSQFGPNRSVELVAR
jgi:hypothetical protein